MLVIACSKLPHLTSQQLAPRNVIKAVRCTLWEGISLSTQLIPA